VLYLLAAKQRPHGAPAVTIAVALLRFNKTLYSLFEQMQSNRAKGHSWAARSSMWATKLIAMEKTPLRPKLE